MKALLHAVSGEGAPGLIERLIAARPEWAALRLPGCPCCTARAVLQVEIAKLLRARRAPRLLVELPDPAHRGMLARVVAEWPLARYVAAGRALRLPEDAALTAEALERD